MPSPDWNDDDELMCDLTDAVRPPVVDERILAAARAAFVWRVADTDLELAQMMDDWVVSDGVRSTDRAPGEPRTLAFQGERLGVEIELSDGRIEGQLIPPVPGRVTLMTSAGPHATVDADMVGCFAFRSPPRGPMRLDCSTREGRFVTEWVTI
jgi:hypothetical protein